MGQQRAGPAFGRQHRGMGSLCRTETFLPENLCRFGIKLGNAAGGSDRCGSARKCDRWRGRSQSLRVLSVRLQSLGAAPRAHEKWALRAANSPQSGQCSLARPGDELRKVGQTDSAVVGLFPTARGGSFRQPIAPCRIAFNFSASTNVMLS